MQSAEQTNPTQGYQYSNEETVSRASADATNTDNYQVASTPDNATVDAFEYEPMGYMSKGRW